MKKSVLFTLFFAFSQVFAQKTAINYDDTKEGKLVFHAIKTDAKGNILPWFNDDLGISLNHCINLTWNFWDTMRIDFNGLPYYMNHQVWREKTNDPRGLGGDQLQMAMSSWNLLYMYTGNERVKENYKFLADYYLTHSLSFENVAYPNIPYPYNTLLYSGFYDGDMIIGKNFTQPDKAGSFGWELLKLYKVMSSYKFPHATELVYLEHAIKIADCLAKNTKIGDSDNSPLPFKVNAITGEIGTLKSNDGSGKIAGYTSYTSNWVGTLCLFNELIEMKKGNIESYKKAHNTILEWMKTYPLKNNKWGPFFEDIPGWSDTQINAITFAEYMLNHPSYFPNWKTEVKSIFEWVYAKVGNKSWQKYGVIVINEQTAYQTPGNSHTARQAQVELLYTKRSGDSTYFKNAIRALAWVTYMVDNDGKNCYPRDEIWFTDGYGDYIRHLLKAMGTNPEIAPENENHIVHSTTIVSQADYAPDINKRLAQDVDNEDLKTIKIYYRTSEENSIETIRMTTKPLKIKIWNDILPETKSIENAGWTWTPLKIGGILKINHKGIDVKVF
ncbi:MAG: hypothetical protein EAZ53_16485 [Bacteroidetes bacterium]|nr:MAG: hypothetical protein EAZ53_16485 [Bacteroidota bacterium]